MNLTGFENPPGLFLSASRSDAILSSKSICPNPFAHFLLPATLFLAK
jgi:hypothetical protein